jgi:hypothetical protein
MFIVAILLCCFRILMARKNFEQFVLKSHRLIAAGSVLASAQFYNELLARSLHSKSRMQLTLEKRHFELTKSTAVSAVQSGSVDSNIPMQTYDWIVLAEDQFHNMTELDANSFLMAYGSLTHYGVLLWAGTKFNQSVVCQGTKFVFVDDQSLLTGESAHVYYQKRLIRQGVSQNRTFPFQYTSDVPVNWTDTAVISGVDFRVYVPELLQKRLQSCDIVVAVNSGRSQQRDVIRRTWASLEKQYRLEIAVFFVTATPTKTMLEEIERYGDLMMFEALEGYNKSWSVLPLKGFGSRQVALGYAKTAAWFFRCDDDTYVHMGNLFAFLNRVSLPNFYNTTMYFGCAFDSAPYRNATGSREKWNASMDVYRPHRYPRYMSGGSGYALSRFAATCIAKAHRSVDWQFFDREDVLVRLTLSEYCSPIVVESRCDLFATHFIQNPPASFIAVHYANSENFMSGLHNYSTFVSIED